MAQSRGFPLVRKMVHSFLDAFLLLPADLLSKLSFEKPADSLCERQAASH